jgi:predicted dehydrogenase
MEGIELVGVVDADPQIAAAVAEEYGTRAVNASEEILDEIDAVSIAVPAVSHFDVAKTFIPRGIHVFMEKPISESSVQAARLVDMVKEAGIVFQTGHIERFNPAIEALSSLLKRPQFIESHRLCTYNPRGCDVGVVMDLMVHDLDIVLHLVGDEIKSVSGVGVNVLSPTEDIANARLEFQHGCIANITVSRVSKDNMRKIRIFQHDAYISLDYRKQEGLIYRKIGGEITAEPVPTEKSEPLKLQLEAFIECVRDGSAPRVTAADGKRVIDVAEQILSDIDARKKAQWAAT